MFNLFRSHDDGADVLGRLFEVVVRVEIHSSLEELIGHQTVYAAKCTHSNTNVNTLPIHTEQHWMVSVMNRCASKVLKHVKCPS